MAFTNLTPREVYAVMTDRTTGDPLNSGVSVTFVLNGGAATGGSGTLRSLGSGAWGYTPTGAEWNGDSAAFLFTHPTGITQASTVYPDTKIVSGLNDFNPSVDAVQQVNNVTLVATTTTNTDMRGTDGAATPGDAMGLTAGAVDSVVDGTWDEAQAAHTTAGTFGGALDADVSTRSSHSPTDVWDPTSTTMIENVGGDRFTTKALEQGPSGGGGGGGATRAIAGGPSVMEIPDPVATTTYRIYVYVYDTNGVSVNADSLPTILAQNANGDDRSSNFNGTVQNPSVGVYYQDYDVADTHLEEQINFQWTVVQSGDTILAPWISYASDAGASVFDANVVAWRGVAPASLDGDLVQTSTQSIDATLQADLIKAFWDYLASAATVPNSLGKRIADNLDATVSSRAAPGDEMDLLPATLANVAAAVLGSTIDTTVDLELAMKAVLAGVAGRTTISVNTVEFLDRAGVPALTVSVDPATEGLRVSSVIAGE